ncbi:hypothetical protein PSENEW3_00006272 [Picochlorum sp. SENEW3]|nr:hypothetical protein PSENEW3_00006272 [Picochlorum sp. SENEW3]|eukprot:CAMPEP_0118797872 /NCGR_PEP_ID=MMETSP1161-20130426/314_1 /TAXON_ID=249345 /ORGANISM="Picochlorum oklahomensis, Strain CCMP2329" /LENGTH=59 /DNA_ID=CAMNT_0006725091 /DNA_START=194 /DNA_END=373 /DNA_ORIENTATION=-
MSQIGQAQKFFQTAKGYIHVKTGTDKITSVVIPLGMTAVATLVWGRGMWNMYCGTGKLE